MSRKVRRRAIRAAGALAAIAWCAAWIVASAYAGAITN